MTQHATGTAPTASASRYLQQLCKHWSHKAKAEFTPEAGSIRFDSGNRLQMTALPDSLSLSVTVPDDGDLAQFQDVVDRHLVRFAFREDLVITWS
ncbi:DUF2218 domain-containing protein [Shimia sediminis]|uniref:DUF2218 domain-containing protein n=1 Tax=Shimia sediminis TaxID=2497945 RepID=UPI000F8EC3E9|nr:DUF2218 domain-containing protein [Shimia sediminis]